MDNSYAQTIETTDTEELRSRTKQEIQERQRQQQAPSVNLQGRELPGSENLLILPAETPCFKVNHFILEVPSRLSPAAHRLAASTLPQDRFRFAQDHLEQYAGQCIGQEGVNLIVKGLTAKILGKGYTTTRLGIPEQDLSSGTLKLTLTPGIIHAIRLAGSEAPRTLGNAFPVPGGNSPITGSEAPRTLGNAFPASSGDILNLRDLEQGLEQMKRVPSQDVDLQIVPSDNLGESDVLVTVKRGKPWKIAASLDDSGTKSTGKVQAGLTFSVDNLFGLSDLLNVGLNADGDRNRGAYGTRGNNAYYSVPSGYWTATLSANDSNYYQRIAGSNQTFISSGKSNFFEGKVSYLFYRDQFKKSSLQFRTGKRFSRAYIDDTEVMVQRRNTTLAEIALLHKHTLGQAQLDVTGAYRWAAPWFGAQDDAANLPDTSPKFRYSLETIDVTLTLPFKVTDKSLTYTGTFRAQNSDTPLYGSEWFSIGNRWSVRGFDGEMTLAAEKGYFLRNDLGILIANTAQVAYFGIDFGKVFGPNVQNLIGNKLAGAAVGMRGSLFKGMTYDIFAGWSLYKPQGFRTSEPAAGFNLLYQM